MDVIYNILKSLKVDMNSTYFELDKKKRVEFISILWDELYKPAYIDSQNDDSQIRPLEIEWMIITDLSIIKERFINEERYEETQIIQDLIEITQNKFNKLYSKR